MRFIVALTIWAAPLCAVALEYPHVAAEPQKTGWPLTAEQRAFVVNKPEHDRRPGREQNRHLPERWPRVPTAGHFGGDSWLKLHEAHVKLVQTNRGPGDVLLVGDSIMIQWADSWKRHVPDLKTIYIDIGEDKTRNVLWRLDHGGPEGLEPKAILLKIGNSNMFFTPETGIEAVALGIEACVRNLREKCPAAVIIVAKILPAHVPGSRFHEDIKKTNAALDPPRFRGGDAKLRVLDPWGDFADVDGIPNHDLFRADNIHLTPAGYAAYATRLRPLLDAAFTQ